MEGVIIISSDSITCPATPQYSPRSPFFRLICHVSSCVVYGSRQNTSRENSNLQLCWQTTYYVDWHFSHSFFCE